MVIYFYDKYIIFHFLDGVYQSFYAAQIRLS